MQLRRRPLGFRPWFKPGKSASSSEKTGSAFHVLHAIPHSITAFLVLGSPGKPGCADESAHGKPGTRGLEINGGLFKVLKTVTADPMSPTLPRGQA
jgi:hypothetical protein